MTCIVAVANQGIVHMGADSMFAAGNDVIPHAVPKLVRVGDVLLGVAGPLRGLDIVRHHLAPPRRTARQDVGRYICVSVTQALRDCLEAHQFESGNGSGVEVLFGCAGRIFALDGDFCCNEIDGPHWAIGSGADYAIGALDALQDSESGLGATARIELALSVSEKRTAGVRRPFSVMWIGEPVPGLPLKTRRKTTK